MSTRQREIADFIDSFWSENWTSPTVREIGRALGMSSPDTVYSHLRKMTALGILERKDVSKSRVLYRVRRSSQATGIHSPCF